MKFKSKEIIYICDEKREKIEDYIAKHILAKWDNFSKVDDLRMAMNLTLINLVIQFAENEGIPANQIPQETREKFAKTGAKLEKKFNRILQAQLQKKSKMYRDRHGN